MVGPSCVCAQKQQSDHVNRNEQNQQKAESVMPRYLDNRSRIAWSMVSKAAMTSYRASKVTNIKNKNHLIYIKTAQLH